MRRNRNPVDFRLCSRGRVLPRRDSISRPACCSDHAGVPANDDYSVLDRRNALTKRLKGVFAGFCHFERDHRGSFMGSWVTSVTRASVIAWRNRRDLFTASSRLILTAVSQPHQLENATGSIAHPAPLDDREIVELLRKVETGKIKMPSSPRAIARREAHATATGKVGR